MKLRDEEVLTYRGMLRYVREGLGRAIVLLGASEDLLETIR